VKSITVSIGAMAICVKLMPSSAIKEILLPAARKQTAKPLNLMIFKKKGQLLAVLFLYY
jgi:hypothetical protein